jgi:hypothetical protein
VRWHAGQRIVAQQPADLVPELRDDGGKALAVCAPQRRREPLRDPLDRLRFGVAGREPSCATAAAVPDGSRASTPCTSATTPVWNPGGTSWTIPKSTKQS